MSTSAHYEHQDLVAGDLIAWTLPQTQIAVRHLGEEHALILTYAEAIALSTWLNGWAAAGNRVLVLHETAKLEADEA